MWHVFDHETATRKSHDEATPKTRVCANNTGVSARAILLLPRENGVRVSDVETSTRILQGEHTPAETVVKFK